MSHIDVEDSLSMIREKRRILRAISKVYQCLNLEGKRMAGLSYQELHFLNRSTKTPILSVHLQNRALVSASVLK